MAINDLTGQNIQDTYQKVVQTDGTNLADGTGSLLPISFDGNNVTISGSLTATEYSVTSSITNMVIATKSGSTAFGDSTSDTHVFSGSVSIHKSSTKEIVSPSVGGSGTVSIGNQANAAYNMDIGSLSDVLPAIGFTLDLQNYALIATNTYTNINTPVGYDIKFTIGGVTLGSEKMRMDQFGRFGIGTTSPSTLLHVAGATTLGNNVTDTHTLTGHITASGANISASSAPAPELEGESVGGTIIANALDIRGPSGHITASGDISSSGEIIATGNIQGNIFDSAGKQYKLNGDKALYLSSTDIYVGHKDHQTYITSSGDGITLSTNVTASGNISASGTISATGALTGTLATVSQPNITTLGGATSIGAVGGYGGLQIGTNILTIDTTQIKHFKADDDANPTYQIGSSVTNMLQTLVGYKSGTQILETVNFRTTTASGTADDGKFLFTVDALNTLDIDDGGIDFYANHGISIAGTDILTDSGGTATLSNIDALDATTEATIESAIDTLGNLTSFGAAGATTNILAGDLTMYEAIATVDANPTFSIGSSAANRLEITSEYNSGNYTMNRAIFKTIASSGGANDGSFAFYVDSVQMFNIDDDGINIVQSKNLSIGGVDILTDSSGTTTLNNIDALDATTEATIETAIDTLSNLTTVGTIGTGVWQGTAVASAYLDSDTAHLTTDQTFSGNKTFSTAITASGNISSSGTIFTNTLSEGNSTTRPGLTLIGNITASGNVSGSGTGSFTAGVTSDGPIRGKTIDIVQAHFKGATGTDLYYLPISGVPDEQTAPHKESSVMIAPCSGRLLRAIVRADLDLSGETCIMTLVVRPKNKLLNGGKTDKDAAEFTGPTITNLEDTNTVLVPFTSAASFVYGDALGVSIQFAETGMESATDRLWVTLVFEYDFETLGY